MYGKQIQQWNTKPIKNKYILVVLVFSFAYAIYCVFSYILYSLFPKMYNLYNVRFCFSSRWYISDFFFISIPISGSKFIVPSYLFIVFVPFLGIICSCFVMYRGFHEKGSLSCLSVLGIDRQSPFALNECRLQEPFI